MTTKTTRATVALDSIEVTYVLHEYAVVEKVGDGYGEAVAAAIGMPSTRVFKTLVAEVDGAAVVAVVPVAVRLSPRLLARAAGGKRAEMVAPEVAERLTGYVSGGISPFAQRRPLDFYVDSSALGHETVAVSGGARGIQLELSPQDLIRATDARVAALVDDDAR
jgi:Cys-tRNA(Pro)/Cys-tRNA(Cys) deacylase